jgi:hypothetical protein
VVGFLILNIFFPEKYHPCGPAAGIAGVFGLGGGTVCYSLYFFPFWVKSLLTFGIAAYFVHFAAMNPSD